MKREIIAEVKGTNMTAICPRSTGKLRLLVTQFFEMVPVRRIQWQNADIAIAELDVEGQRYILSSTVNCELCQLYPPSIQYQKAFVKKLLNTLESCGVEICDELYETYTQLLQHVEAEEDVLCYKTYTVADDVRITIRESVNMISCGTTGLSTWQAAQHLVEWAVQNQNLLGNRNVLELGCGLGLTGITLCKLCHVNVYTFTDCHAKVLDGLVHNIELNFCENKLSKTQQADINQSEESWKGGKDFNGCSSDSSLETCAKTHQSCDPGYAKLEPDWVTSDSTIDCDTDNTRADLPAVTSANYKHCENTDRVQNVETLDARTDVRTFKINQPSMCKGIQTAFLDWENIDQSLINQLSDIDLIMAADVVYDTTIIPGLVSVLKVFLSNQATHPVAYIASTIRNEDTRDQFLVSLSNEGLKYEPVEPPSIQLFHYDRSLPIEIIRITLPL